LFQTMFNDIEFNEDLTRVNSSITSLLSAAAALRF